MHAAWGVQGPGSRVGVMLRNCAEVMEVHFACAALHALVVNVNVNLAARELRHVLEDSGCTALVADAEFGELVAAALAPEPEGGKQPPPLRVEAWVSKAAAGRPQQVPSWSCDLVHNIPSHSPSMPCSPYSYGVPTTLPTSRVRDQWALVHYMHVNRT